MVKNHVMLGSTIVTNEMLYPLLHNLPGIGEVISTEALMNLDINHDHKSLKNLGLYIVINFIEQLNWYLWMIFLFRNYMGNHCRSLHSTTRYVYNTC